MKLKTHKQNQRNKKPKLGVHGEIGPTGRIGTPLRLVEVDLAHIEQRVVAAAMMQNPIEINASLTYGGTITGRYNTGPAPWPTPEGEYRDQIINHDIPADRLPPAAPMVDDE